MAKRYGIYDTQDKLWCGDDAGPKSFGEGDKINGQVVDDDTALVLAKIASEVLNRRMGWGLHRAEAREIPQASDWHERDELVYQHSDLDVLRRIERGVI